MPTLVLALNPSIDAEWRVDTVQWEEKNLVRSERRWAGGKGVNVARWFRHLGGTARLLAPLGGPTGAEMRRLLGNENVAAKVVALRETTRVNVIVTTARGQQMRFNPPGPRLSALEWKTVFRETKTQLGPNTSLVLSGSLPRSSPATAYARLIGLGRRAGCKIFLDCDGAALGAAIPAQPFLVKPNEYELAHWRGRRLRSVSEVLAAAQAMSVATGGWVLASRGARGSVLVNAAERHAFAARAPQVQTLNTVGAGDAMLAAAVLQVERGAAPAEWLRWSIATGTAATQCRAGQMPKLDLIRRLAASIRVASV